MLFAETIFDNVKSATCCYDLKPRNCVNSVDSAIKLSRLRLSEWITSM